MCFLKKFLAPENQGKKHSTKQLKIGLLYQNFNKKIAQVCTVAKLASKDQPNGPFFAYKH